MGEAVKSTRYAISWIYYEFHITRLQHGYPMESWKAPYAVHDLATLSRAMADSGNHIDLSRGGDVAIAYEDDLHTHEFFNVPAMDKKDLEKLLQRKVEYNKPFDDEASWCYHEAKHSETEEGILLHRLPKRIVDAIIRICQEFYLGPKRLVPLSEIVSDIVPHYGMAEDKMIAVVSLFSERTEIVVTLGNGEALFVRELSYAAGSENQVRLITDINRTIHYSKQQFGKPIDDVWLIGESATEAEQLMAAQIEAEVHVDEDGLDPLYWAIAVSRLSNRRSANFIPLLARKKINRTLFARIAVWASPVVVSASLFLFAVTGHMLENQTVINRGLEAEHAELEKQIDHTRVLISRRDQSMKKLSLLQADNRNLPALFISHLGEMVPVGLVLHRSEVMLVENEWKVSLKGESSLTLQNAVALLQQLEQALTQAPWNITITQSWKNSWYQQLQTGSASAAGATGFEITGWMR